MSASMISTKAHGVPPIDGALTRNGTGDAVSTPISIFDELQGHPIVVRRPDRTRLHTAEAGEGPAVVLVHGFGMDMHSWSLVQPALVHHGLRVIAYDQRGHGCSTVGTDGTTSQALFDDLVAVVEHYDLNDAILVGHSMGTFAAMGALANTALRRRTRAAILAAAETGTLMRGANASTKMMAPLLGLGVLPYMLRIPGMGTTSAARICGPDASPEVVEATRRALATAQPDGNGFFKVMKDESVTGALPAIDLPLTVIRGEADGSTPEWHSRTIVERAPQAELTLVPGVGHMVNWEAPETIIDAVIAAAQSESKAAPSKHKA